MRTRILRVCVLVLALASVAPAQVALYTVTFQDDQVRHVDPVSGVTLSQQLIVLPGETITQGVALAVDPTTGVMYSVLSVQTQPARRLVTLDPTTGQATLVGLLPDRFSGLAFDDAGQLFGVTGDGAATPESLFAIDKTNASATLVTNLGNGSSGETIGFQPSDGLLYHASGNGALDDALNGLILETVNPTTAAITSVPLTGVTPTGIQCLARLDASTFLMFDQVGFTYTVSTSGVITQLAPILDHLPKGAAFAPGPSYFESYGVGCAGSGGFVPQLGGSPSPNPGSPVTLSMTQGLGGAPGLLLFGVGTGSAPVVGSCNVQVIPLTPLVLSIGLFGSGPGNGALAFGATMPAFAPPGDIYLQALFADPGAADGVSATAPLHLHLQ